VRTPTEGARSSSWLREQARHFRGDGLLGWDRRAGRR
jgi:hypothetical protein